jgi:hypothetical protein
MSREADLVDLIKSANEIYSNQFCYALQQSGLI